MRFEDVSVSVGKAVAALIRDVTRDGADGLGRAVVGYAVADRMLPSALTTARNRLRAAGRVIARRAELFAVLFAVEDLGGALAAYIEWRERTGGAEDLERLTADLITAAVRSNRTGDSTELEAALELYRIVAGEDH